MTIFENDMKKNKFQPFFRSFKSVFFCHKRNENCLIIDRIGSILILRIRIVWMHGDNYTKTLLQMLLIQSLHFDYFIVTSAVEKRIRSFGEIIHHIRCVQQWNPLRIMPRQAQQVLRNRNIHICTIYRHRFDRSKTTFDVSSKKFEKVLWNWRAIQFRNLPNDVPLFTN